MSVRDSISALKSCVSKYKTMEISLYSDFKHPDERVSKLKENISNLEKLKGNTEKAINEIKKSSSIFDRIVKLFNVSLQKQGIQAIANMKTDIAYLQTYVKHLTPFKESDIAANGNKPITMTLEDFLNA